MTLSRSIASVASMCLALGACQEPPPIAADATEGPVSGFTSTASEDPTTTGITAADTTAAGSSSSTGEGSSSTGCTTDCQPEPWGLDERPPNATCVPPPPLPPSSIAGFERVYDQVEWAGPTSGAFSPLVPDRLYLSEKRGLLRWADPGSTEPTTALDLQTVVSTSSDLGLVSFVFDPQFAESGRLYVVYNTSCERSTVCPPPGPDVGTNVSRLARFTSIDGGLTFPVETEEIILDLWQPGDTHTMDQPAFGPDGLLYVGAGDGGLQKDPLGLAQNLGSLNGKIMRLDVSGVGPGYAVPPDNPFFAVPGAAPEVYALGLRNPWRISFDRDTGELWVGDVGQATFEEVDRVEAGGNYGWNLEEGPFCFGNPKCNVEGVIDPVAWYSHDTGVSIVGGYVYRGTDVPGLTGAYVFADYLVGRLWALWTDGAHLDLEVDVSGPYAEELLFEAGDSVVTFVEDADGELYYVASVVYGDAPGRVYQLVPPTPPPKDFPMQLSQTGCFEPDDPATPTPGLIPYDLVAPFWSDGATKQRWMALPDDAWALVTRDGDIDFPPGTVLAKQFEHEGALVETRLLVHHEQGGWTGYTYRWRDDQTDAELVETELDVPQGSVMWHFPSRGECMFCHTEAAGRSLGPELRQLDVPMLYPTTGITANQLDTLTHIGVVRFPSEDAHFAFDEGRGTMVQWGEHTATLENGPTWTSEGLYFDGVDDVVRTDVPNGPVRTLAAWIRPETSEIVPFMEGVVDSDLPNEYGSGFGLLEGGIVVVLDDQVWYTYVPAPLAQWYHVALGYDDDRATLWVDGVVAGTLDYQRRQVSEANYVIGASNSTPSFYNGELRDVRIFDGMLSDDDVARVRDGLDPEPITWEGPYPDPLGDAPVVDRARSWLHTNCAQCHQPGGPGRGDYDMRFETPWAETGLCDAVPVGNGYGIPDVRTVAPGDPDRSLLLYRIGATGPARMPPVSSEVVDQEGVDLIRAWIEGLAGCP